MGSDRTIIHILRCLFPITIDKFPAFFALRSLIHKQTSHTLSRTNTHARQQNLLLCPAQLAQTGNNLSRACSAERVAQGDGAAAGVHLGPVEGELVAAVDGHAGEGLIDLDDVNVGEGEVVLGEQLGDSDGRANAHDARGQAGDGGADVLGDDGLAELDGRGALHQEDGGS